MSTSPISDAVCGTLITNPISTALRCATYHRVSTLDQDVTLADRQLLTTVERVGGRVVLAAREHASGAGVRRPEFDRVMDAARRGDLDCVVVYKLDRFGRSALDLLANLRHLEQSGVRFVCASQPIDIGAAGDPMSRLMVNMLAAFAEFERDLIKERTRAGLEAARKRGVVLGRPYSTAPTALIQELRAQGASWSAIAKQCGVSVNVARSRAAAVSKGAPTE